jgi:hypothetical protein
MISFQDFGHKLGYSVIITTNLGNNSGRGRKENYITKIPVKKVWVLGPISYLRLTPPPPKDAPAAVQKLYTLAFRNEVII